ncbi:MAG: glutamyl-tRNA reductase [Deltaproteobacteria bacterium]|nr:glutamyl-tRNA reductase [Deltaproteobacteria bacterium]MBN2672372.1 glutamyl-tRNA reductase [Deltaproteobacteria bacterium]
MTKLTKIPFVIGSSFHTAPLEMLEKLSIGKDELQSVIKEMAGWVQTEDLVVLSTCNRTEIIGSTEDIESTRQKIVTYLNTVCGDIELLPEHLYCHSENDAVAHLFQVASGMDSMIMGETEIIGQLQQAFAVSQCEGLVSNYFVQLFDAVFRTGKRVRTETDIDKGTTSVAKAAVHMSKRIVGDLAQKHVLMIGAGETGRLACTYLAEEQAVIFVANRTDEKARQLASEVNAAPVPFEDIASILTKVDVVYLATGAKTPLITKAMIADAQKKRKGELLLVVDISLPHNVDPSITDVGNVFLFDMNDLKEMVATSISKRTAEKKHAQCIVREETEAFFDRQRTLEVGPLIQALRSSFHEVSQQELERFENKFRTEDKALLEQFAQSIVNKLLHWPTMGVRELAHEQDAPFDKAQWFEKLFGLDKTVEERKSKK